MTLDHECLRSADTKSRAPCPNGSVYWQSPLDMAYTGSIPDSYTDLPGVRFDPCRGRLRAPQSSGENSGNATKLTCMQGSPPAVLRSTMHIFTWRRFTVESAPHFYGPQFAFHYSFYSPFTSVVRLGTSLFCRFAR